MENTNEQYPFGCECGERYNSVDAARFCRKCRVYLSHEDNTGRVVDLRTDTVVVEGRKPLPPVDRSDWLSVDPKFLE
jgi:hypothetical protein